jgi:hypothetical protein
VAKAQRLLDGAAESGWSVTVDRDGETGLIVQLVSGDASITGTFAEGKLDLSRMPSYIRAAGAKPVQLKNVSAALAVMASPAG